MMMTDEQKIADVMARIAVLNADVAGMQAFNMYRDRRGETIGYIEDSFEKAIEDSGLRNVHDFFMAKSNNKPRSEETT